MSERLTDYPQAMDWFDPDIRLGSILTALWRRKLWIAGAVGSAIAIGLVVLASVPARYSSEARVLIERNDNAFAKPLQERDVVQVQLDKEAAASQVQLLLSRDLGKTVVEKLKLADSPEFAGSASVSPLGLLMRVVGLQKRADQSPEERILDAFYDHLNVFQIQDSRVITVEFRSHSPELAAKAANALVDGYIDLQRNTKRDATRQASSWLGVEIERLRKKVEEAEQRVEEFRGQSGLLLGTNNTSLNAQRLSELNTQLVQAQAQYSQAQTKADALRGVLRTGRLDTAPDVLNSPLIQRLQESQVALRAQVAQLSTTLLPAHPRLRELNAQLANLQAQIRVEAEKIAHGFEAEAKLAKAREESLRAALDALKTDATKANDQEVQLRALEREAKAQRELLESFLARYREASARENFDNLPPDARIISRATVPVSPSFPKPVPLLTALVAAAFLLSTGLIVSLELVSGRGPARPPLRPVPTPLPSSGADREMPAQPAAAGNVVPVPRISRMSSLDELAHALSEVQDRGGAPRVVVAGAVDDVAAAVALGFGRQLARQGRRVVLLDAAVDNPQISDGCGDREGPGLTQLLRQETSFSAALVRDRGSRLHLLPLGADRGSLPDLLASERMQLVLSALRSTYDIVIVHLGTSEAASAALAKVSDHAVFATTADRPEGADMDCCEELLAAGAPDVTLFTVDLAALSAA